MNDLRRPLALLVAAALLGVVFFFFRTRAPSKPARARTAPSTEAAPSVAAETPPTPEAHAEARRARDAMRAKIVEALRRRAPVPAAAPAPATTPAARRPAPAADEDLPHGHYEKSYIQKNFREDMFPILKQCYGAALERQPDLHGKLVLKFSIVGDPDVGGVVEDASIGDESTLKDDELETCARESLMALTFDKPPSGGGLVTVSYPILFSPGDDDEAGAPEAGAPPG